MSFFTSRLGAASLAALLGGTSAQADVTAAEVWQAWIDYSATMGQTVETGGQDQSGDTLVITDAVFRGSQPDGSFSLTIPEIRLRETGGTVEITVSEEMPMIADSTGEAGEKVSMAMLLTQQGLVTVASGTTGDMTYDLTAPAIGFEMGDMTVDGVPVDMTLTAALRDTAARYRATEGDAQRITSGMTAAALEFTMAVTDPEGGGTFRIDGGLADLSGESDVTTPEGMNPDDMAAALNAGLAMTGGFRYGEGAYSMDFADGAQTVQAQVRGQGGTLDAALSQEGLRYAVTGNGTEVAAEVSDLPFPVSLSIAETGFSFQMPLSAGENAPFGMALRLVGLTVSEEIWAMVDPSGQLPRDPATLVLDLSGRADVTADLTDPAVGEMTTPPGELRSLDLNQLQLTVAGADLTGQGALTFDNTDLSMGFPKPTGAVDLALTGGNALLDRLVAMGALPEDQAMGARMMLGLFAVPTGPDSLSSKIEFREDGGIYANGQRIQ